MNTCDSGFSLLHTKVVLQHLAILPAFHRYTWFKVALYLCLQTWPAWPKCKGCCFICRQTLTSDNLQLPLSPSYSLMKVNLFWLQDSCTYQFSSYDPFTLMSRYDKAACATEVSFKGLVSATPVTRLIISIPLQVWPLKLTQGTKKCAVLVLKMIQNKCLKGMLQQKLLREKWFLSNNHCFNLWPWVESIYQKNPCFLSSNFMLVS